MKHLGDVTKIDGKSAPLVDCIIGGSPCQDLSVAGLRKGIQHEGQGDEETTRSGLAYEMFRIIKEMRDRVKDNRGAVDVRHPRFALWENVPGALSAGAADGGKGTAFQCVLTEFIRCEQQEAPAVPIPKDGWPNAGAIVFNDGHSSLAWRIIDLQYFGCPQRRRRAALLCDYDGLSAAKILFEQYPASGRRSEVSSVCKSLPGDTCESEQAREATAGATAESIDGHG